VTDTSKILFQLRQLAQLTQTETQVAQTRIGQARTDAVRRELTENAANAQERSQAIGELIRELGGVPDVVSPAVGRLAALAKAAVDTAEPLDEALLQDLALEHQLLDRARYLKALAEAGKQQKVKKLAERLITAHSATVDWITTVLAEHALGGPAALRATPFQRVAGGASRLVNLPARFAVEQVNRTVNSVQQTGEQTREKVGQVADRTTQLGSVVREVFTTGRDASLQKAEKVARREGDKQTAASVHETRRDLGALTVSELPIKNYDKLTTQQAIAAVKKLQSAEDIGAIVRFEEAHDARSSVVSAAQTQLAAVAKELVGVTS
jgi:bacterioferritin (cytochrome b1)